MSSATPHARPEPKYYTVKRHLLAIIESLDLGSAVPTERVLATELGTSRTTVRQALLELVAEGLLVRRQGAGTYVAEPKMDWPLHLTSFTAQAAQNGFTASNRMLGMERIKAEPAVAERLGIAAGGPIWRMERLRLADDRPMAVETSHLAAGRFPRLSRYMRHEQSLYAVLERVYGVVPASAVESISTAPASPREAQLLNTDTGAPMLVLGRHSRDRTGRPVEWVTSWYRGDRVTFIANLQAQQR